MNNPRFQLSLQTFYGVVTDIVFDPDCTGNFDKFTAFWEHHKTGELHQTTSYYVGYKENFLKILSEKNFEIADWITKVYDAQKSREAFIAAYQFAKDAEHGKF